MSRWRVVFPPFRRLACAEPPPPLKGRLLNLCSSETVFSPSLFVFPVRQKRAVCPLPVRGWEQGVQGGRIRPPAHRRASKASLEPERLAEPISRANTGAPNGVTVRSKEGRLRPPAHRRASKASLEPERLAEPISRAKHRHAEWRDGAKQGGPLKAPCPPEGAAARKSKNT